MEDKEEDNIDRDIRLKIKRYETLLQEVVSIYIYIIYFNIILIILYVHFNSLKCYNNLF